MKKLLYSTGNVGDEFNATCKAIVEAGRSQGGQTDESREIEQFWSGRQGEVYTQSGSLDDYT